MLSNGISLVLRDPHGLAFLFCERGRHLRRKSHEGQICPWRLESAVMQTVTSYTLMQGTYEAKALWRSHARSLMLETKQKLVAASLRRVYLRQALALKPGSPLVLSPKWWDYRYASTGPVSRTFGMKGFSGWSLAAGYMDMKCITTQGMWELVPSLAVSLDQGGSNAQHFSFVCVRAYMHVHVCASIHTCMCMCVCEARGQPLVCFSG